jgi:hypothetical protein
MEASLIEGKRNGNKSEKLIPRGWKQNVLSAVSRDNITMKARD